MKTFTTTKKSNGEKYSSNFIIRFEFKVNFKTDADIYFGVGMSGDSYY